MTISRREETMIRERIYAWLMENGKVNWFKHLNEIKYMHNSEWIEELGTRVKSLRPKIALCWLARENRARFAFIRTL